VDVEALGHRHVAALGQSDDLFVTGAWDREVCLWSLAGRKLVSRLDTVLDGGGRRLALCRRGPDRAPVVVAGAYTRHGVRAYDPTNGDILWERKDLRGLGALGAAVGGDAVAVNGERPLQILDASTGETVARLRGVRDFKADARSHLALAAPFARLGVVDTRTWKRCWSVAVDAWATFDAAFSDTAILVSVAPNRPAAATHCYTLTGERRWAREAPAETTLLNVGWDAERRHWLGVRHHVNNRHPDLLVSWDEDGEPLTEIPLRGHSDDYAFMADDRLLVLSMSGEVCDARTGDVVWRFADVK
jgi:hypothetical protein